MAKRGTVSVVGQGTAVGTPDVCRVRLDVTALRPAVADALAESEQAVRQVREGLTAHGVAARDAATGSVSITAEQDYSGQRGPRLVGYRATHSLTVVLRDLAGAGRALGEAVAAGGDAVRLEGVDFTVEDDTELRVEARAAAWRDAERAARQLADLAGRTLAGVRSVEALGGAVPLPQRASRYDAVAASGPSEIGLEPGAVDVRVALAVVWELT